MGSHISRSLAFLRGVETRFLIAVFLAIVAVWGFMVLANSVGAAPGPIDRKVYNWLFAEGNGFPLGSHRLADTARDVTALGSAFILTLLTLTAVAYLFVRQDRPGGFFLLAVVLGAALLSSVLKLAVARERPDLASPYVFETSASFPSGHSLLSAALYPALAVILARRERRSALHLLFLINAILVVALVGVSRVLLGAHYPTDVLAGWSAGFFWVTTCRVGLAWVENRGKRKRGEEKLS